MGLIVNDISFGEMTYKRGWKKTEDFTFFGKNYQLSVIAKSFSEKPITKEQRESYVWVKNNIEQIDIKLTSMLIDYINDQIDTISLYWAGARIIDAAEDVSQVVDLKTILFKNDGSTIILCDCVWDEHGLAVQLRPDYEIGEQDLFL